MTFVRRTGEECSQLAFLKASARRWIPRFRFGQAFYILRPYKDVPVLESCNDSALALDSPGTLDMKGVLAHDLTFHPSNLAEMKPSHVAGMVGDSELIADEYLEHRSNVSCPSHCGPPLSPHPNIAMICSKISCFVRSWPVIARCKASNCAGVSGLWPGHCCRYFASAQFNSAAWPAWLCGLCPLKMGPGLGASTMMAPTPITIVPITSIRPHGSTNTHTPSRITPPAPIAPPVPMKGDPEPWPVPVGSGSTPRGVPPCIPGRSDPTLPESSPPEPPPPSPPPAPPPAQYSPESLQSPSSGSSLSSRPVGSYRFTGSPRVYAYRFQLPGSVGPALF